MLLFYLFFIILIHESGHYFFARYFGMRVLTFSIGFGPRLLGWNKDNGFTTGNNGSSTSNTDFRISLLPLGGYVNIQGAGTHKYLSNNKEDFNKKPAWQRLIVLSAGIGINIIFAFILLNALHISFLPILTTLLNPLYIFGMHIPPMHGLAQLAVWSLYLGIFNVLPLPFLDGGFIFMTIYELIDGEPISMRFQKNFYTFGYVLMAVYFISIFIFA